VPVAVPVTVGWLYDYVEELRSSHVPEDDEVLTMPKGLAIMNDLGCYTCSPSMLPSSSVNNVRRDDTQ
jgi:hypothetical protein